MQHFWTLILQVIDSSGNFVEPILKDNKDSTFACKYVPKAIGKHTLQVNHENNNIHPTEKITPKFLVLLKK